MSIAEKTLLYDECRRMLEENGRMLYENDALIDDISTDDESC